MQCRQHQVTGQRRFHSDLRGFEVAHLSDHDDIWVLPQERAQGSRECQPRLFVDLHLRNARQLILDRVLNRDNILLDRVDLVQHRVQRRRLARAGRPSRQKHSVRLSDQFFELCLNFWSKTKFI